MVEEKKPKEKKVVQIKASTGAWWKSTSSAEDKKDDSTAKTTVKAKSRAKKTVPAKKTEADTPQAETPKTAPKPRTRKPRTRKTPEKTASNLKQTVEQKAAAVAEEFEKAAGEEKQVKKKAPAKRTRTTAKSTGRGRKKSPAAEKPQASQEITDSAKSAEGSVAGEELATAPPAGRIADKADTQEEQASAPESPAAEEKGTKNKRKPRPRRARKSKPQAKKSTAAQEVEAAEVPQAGEVDSEAADATPVEETAAADSSSADTDGKAEQQAETEKEKAAVKVCKLLINAEEPEECRLALLEDGRLESIHVTTVATNHTKNNIYKARIVAIEPSLQAAFVDYGREKNGFLPFSEIHPEYYKQELSEDIRRLVENHQWKKLSITDVLEKGQEVLAQVVKEEVGKKGANMTTYLSIPGRCVVLMPGSDSSGISRKISGEEKRSELRDVMKSIEMPEGIGWIVRTASVDITKTALSRDVEHLLVLWDKIKRRGQEMDGVGMVYEDQQSIQRFLREHFDPAIEEILVDDKDAMEQVKDFIAMLPSAQRDVKVRLHQGARPIFNHFSVEDQIESIYQPRVNLPSGGSIVIDPTEALVAIDVNSGSTSKGKNFEASIFQANMEAATELARQLRLRDLGGLIVVDFIDMRNKKHVQAVERQVRQSMKRDKAKVDFTRISKFGLMQISRQKLGAPIEAGNYRRCNHCQGRGIVRSVETLALYYLRRVQTGASRKHIVKIEGHFPLDVASYLLNSKRNELRDMEDRYHVEILIIGDPDMRPMDNDLIFHKAEKDPIGKKQA